MSQPVNSRLRVAVFQNETDPANVPKIIIADALETTTVRNYSELRAVDGTGLKIAQLSGRSSPGDGGVGAFFWTPGSGSDDRGAILTGSGGYWSRFNAETLNVKWFGATGDGVTDDAPAFRLAVSASAMRNPPTPIFVPAGVYVMSSSFQTTSTVANGKCAFMLTASQTLYGEGRQSVIYWPGGSPKQVNFNNDDPMTYSLIIPLGRNIHISDLRFQGENGDQFGNNYCFSDNYQHAAIDPWFDSTNPSPDFTLCQGLEVTDCYFENLYAFSCHGGGTDAFSRYCRNTFKYCGNGLNPNSNDVEIMDNTFISAEGIEVAGSRIRIKGNYFLGKVGVISVTGNPSPSPQTRDITIDGNHFDGTLADNSSSGGTLSNAGAIAIIADNVKNCIISNNDFRNAPLYAIYVNADVDRRNTQVTIVGNSIHIDSAWLAAPGTAAGMYIFRTDQSVVSSNVIAKSGSGGAFGIVLDDTNGLILSTNHITGNNFDILVNPNVTGSKAIGNTWFTTSIASTGSFTYFQGNG